MQSKLEEAIELRNKKEPEAALVVLKSLLESHPDDPNVHYQIAWTCDSMGRETEAAHSYEKAFEHGLSVDRLGATLGLGSTYRCIGEFGKSLATLDRGVEEFPENRALKVFRALTLYNLGRYEESTRELLIQLVETTKNESIRSYERALRFYSERLNETWL